MAVSVRTPGKFLAIVAVAAAATFITAGRAAATPMKPLPAPPAAPADQPFPPDYVVPGSQREDPFDKSRATANRATLVAARETFERTNQPTAARALTNFLKGKGTTFELTSTEVDGLLKTDSALFELVEKTAAAQGRAAMMRARMDRSLYGQQLTYRGEWQQPEETHRLADWKNTLGHFSVAVTSVVVPRKEGGYTQNRKVYIYDIYDFSATNKYDGAGQSAANAGAWLNGQGDCKNFITRGTSSASQQYFPA